MLLLLLAAAALAQPEELLQRGTTAYNAGDAAQAQLQAEVKQNPASLKKMEWCQQWTNSKASFGLRLLAFAAVQSVMHCGAFACLTYAGNKGLNGRSFTHTKERERERERE